MRDFAKRSEKDRQDIFRATAESKSIREAIVEKDFWVCWVLDYLFHDNQWKESMAFKGGTSLSKAYGAIERFSEDVDLILDWRLLGYSEDEPFQKRTRAKQTKFCDEAFSKTTEFLKTEFVPKIQYDLNQRLGQEIVITQDEHSIFIKYLQTFSNASLRREIVLEIGPRALHEPNEIKGIRPYAVDYRPEIFSIPSTQVRTVNAERTFWEKATILHQEAHRPDDKDMPLRYSRHYYDLYRLSKNTLIMEKSIEHPELLESVVKFKMAFFPSAWAKYEEAVPKTIKLMPPKNRVSELKKDYQSMQAMLFGDIPSFEEILEGLSSLEIKINSQGDRL